MGDGETVCKKNLAQHKVEINREMTQISFCLVKKKEKDFNKVIMIKHRNFCPVTSCTEILYLFKIFSYSEFFSEQLSHLYFSSCRSRGSSWQPHWCKREETFLSSISPENEGLRYINIHDPKKRETAMIWGQQVLKALSCPPWS